MSPERRYNEQEIAAIFKQAAVDQESEQRNSVPNEGLTLAEIKQIGQEVGITPEYIARAAASVDQTIATPPPSTTLGFPVSVARTVDLPGAFSDDDWNRLVTDLHETFHVHGEVQHNGPFRQWRYGNIQVLVEPTESGHRLRLRTLSDALRGGLMGSLGLILMGLFFMLLVAAKGDFAVDLGKTLFVSMFSVVGLGGLGVTAYRLPRWREERGRQMEAIAARAVERATAQTVTTPQQIAAAPHATLDLPMESEEAEQIRVPRKTRS